MFPTRSNQGSLGKMTNSFAGKAKMGLITMTETFKDFWTLLSMKELLKILNLYLNHTPLDLTSIQSRGRTRVPPTSSGAPFPPSSSRRGILSLRRRERIPKYSLYQSQGLMLVQ